MGHISGGAASGIGFGVALFVFVGVAMGLWWRRVHKDHFSKDPNAWGGSWGTKAQKELQERINKQREQEWKAQEEDWTKRTEGLTMRNEDVEMRGVGRGEGLTRQEDGGRTGEAVGAHVAEAGQADGVTGSAPVSGAK